MPSLLNRCKILSDITLKFFSISFLSISFFNVEVCFAAHRSVDLAIGHKAVNFAHKISHQAIAVNDQIPAPTLHFQKGDYVTINVCNNLDEGTTIHWHGVLVPWQMDGVEGVTQKAIMPGETFQYQFTLHQSGTYWYHAHAGAQEQQGVYGAFIINPAESPAYQYTKDYVIVLSDWSNTSGDGVLRNLKKDGEYYSPKFPLQPSLMKFVHDYRKSAQEEKKLLLEDYKMMQQMRMNIYDISDVAYDAYLLNGQTKSCPWTATVKVGDVVRLRFIGASGSTIYQVKIPETKMKIVHIQGNDVMPYEIDNFSIAPGETIDVLVTIKKDKPHIIYAESIDTRGFAVGGLITHPDQEINYCSVKPFAEPKPVTREMMASMMMGMDHGSHGSMKMNNHKMSNNMKMSSMLHETKSMDHMMHNKNHTSQKGMYNMKMHSSMNMNHKMGINDSMTMDKGMKMNHGMHMDHSMKMPTEPKIVGDTICPLKVLPKRKMKTCPVDKEISREQRNCADDTSSETMTMGTKYQNLMAAVKTNNPDKPVDGVIKMELFGYMDRFIWMINGLPEYKTKPIAIEQGKRYRIIYINNSMMRHPMHIHGHWFILRNGKGAYDPLLHTIEVPPGATAVADVDADASGQWFFHCHHLYHMMSGMSRVFQYNTIIKVEEGKLKPQRLIREEPYTNRPIIRVDELRPIDHSLIHHPMAHPMGLYCANFLDFGVDPFHNAQKWTFKGLYGNDYNKLELFSEDGEVRKGKVEEADLDIFYWRLISQFWAIKGGVNYFYRPAKRPYWQPGIGIEGLMPYFIDTNIRLYLHSGSIKLDTILSRDTQLTNNFFIRTGIRGIFATKTVVSDEVGSGFNQVRYTIRPFYRLTTYLFLFMEYEHTQDYGALKRLLQNIGEPTREDVLTFGVSLIF